MKHTRKISFVLVLMMVLMMTLAIIPASAASQPEKLYLTPNANWKADNARFAAYFFGNGETWVSMTYNSSLGVYEVTVPTTKVYPSVIFCRMNPSASANNWNNKWNQTADLTIPTSGANHYTVKEGTWDSGGGTWSTLGSTCAHANKSAEATCTTAQTCLDCGDPVVSALGHTYNSAHLCTRCNTQATFTVAGSGAHLGTEWDTGNTANDMTYADGVYTKVYTNVAAGSYLLKVARDHDWGTAYPSTDKAYTVATDGSTVTVTLKGTTVTITVEVPHVHSWSDATCTEAQKCECGETQGEALGHTWSDATCEAAKTCNVCGTTEGEALGHNYVDDYCTVCGGKDPSACDHEYTYACDKACNKCYQVVREDAAHTIVHVEAVEATCTENGNIEYWYCSDCGYAWADEALTQQTSQMSVVVPAAHSYFYPCDPVCMVCYEITNPEATHTIVHVEAVEVTCTTNGNVEHWYCSDCGNAWTDEAHTQVTNLRSVIVPAPGHSYVDGKCQCGAIDYTYTVSVYFENNWSWPAVSVYYWLSDGTYNAAWPGVTLTDDDIVGANDQGYKIYKIEVPVYASGIVFSGEGGYGRDQSENVLPGDDGKIAGCVCYYMLWNETTQKKEAVPYEYGHVAGPEATCTSAQVCTECSKELAPATGHSYFYPCDIVCQVCYEESNPEATHNVVHVEAVAASCYENGNVEYWYCSDCGAAWLDEAQTQVTNQMSIVVPMAHTSVTHVEAADATCYENGNIEYWYCEACGQAWLDEACTLNTNLLAVVLPMAHAPATHVAAAAASCTENGNIEYWYCEACGQAWLDEACTLNTNLLAVVLPAAHTYTDNCDAECDLCGEFRDAPHNLTEHVDAVVPANCKEEGHDEYWICADCGGYFMSNGMGGYYETNPAWMYYTGEHVRPEGAIVCAVVACELCGEDTYGESCDRGDAPVCQDATCVNCGEIVWGWGCNYNTGDEEVPAPLCQPGDCVYCGTHYEKLYDCENGSWAPCTYDGECSYGCGKQYPATGEHAIDNACEGGTCWLCWVTIEGTGHSYDEFSEVVIVDGTPYAVYACECEATENRSIYKAKGGSIRFELADGTQAPLNAVSLRIGYQIDINAYNWLKANGNITWGWDYQLLAADGSVAVSANKAGENIAADGITSVVFANVPFNSIAKKISVTMSVSVTVDGQTVTISDAEPTVRTILAVLEGVYGNPNDAAYDYVCAVLGEYKNYNTEYALPVKED